MALGDPYVTITVLKAYLPIADTADDADLTTAVATASEWITQWCGRDFNLASSATARVFNPDSLGVVQVDDISSTTGLVVKTDTTDNGTYDTTWTSADYQLEPLNGVVDGLTGWPYTRIRAVETLTFPRWNKRASVEVTAAWGWAEIPSAVTSATLMQASRFFKRADSPEGVLGGFGDFGPVRVGTRLDPDVQLILTRYRKHTVGVG